jgi:hypothetical protein
MVLSDVRMCVQMVLLLMHVCAYACCFIKCAYAFVVILEGRAPLTGMTIALPSRAVEALGRHHSLIVTILIRGACNQSWVRVCPSHECQAPSVRASRCRACRYPYPTFIVATTRCTGQPALVRSCDNGRAIHRFAVVLCDLMDNAVSDSGCPIFLTLLS